MPGLSATRTRTAGRRAAAAVLEVAPWAVLAAVWAFAMRDRGRPKAGLSKAGAAPPEQFEAAEPGHGRLARAPAHIPLTGWRDILWRAWLEVNQDKLPSVAAGVTFYTLLAIFPAVGAFVSLYGLFADVATVRGQLNDMAAFVPREVLTLVGDQMMAIATKQNAGLSVAFVLNLLLSLWTANAGMAALFDGLNVAYDETEKRNFFVRRAITYAFTAALVVFATVVTAVLVAVPIYLRRLGLIDTWLAPFRWVVLTALAACAFAVLYRFGPSRQEARWRWVRPGAVFAAAAWVGSSLAFSWYVNHVAHYDATYGSLGAAVGFMMWIWVSVMVVLIGAELNAEIEHQTALDSTTGAPLPMGARGAEMADTVGLPFQGLRKLWGDLRTKVHG
ncbi:MAG: ribonuclease [Phenylobacterium sp.]|nr:ribonuclease [Phenylobacterium sp.]